MIAIYLFGVCSGGLLMVAIIAISDAIEAYQYRKECERRNINGRKNKNKNKKG